jgi:hypothetical protein
MEKECGCLRMEKEMVSTVNVPCNQANETHIYIQHPSPEVVKLHAMKKVRKISPWKSTFSLQ